jgi:hypothetical protein
MHFFFRNSAQFQFFYTVCSAYFVHTITIKERKALVLDVTDTYFAGSQADWKGRKGKDGKYGKLIQIALAVTKDEGFPIMHRTYEGNIRNIYIFKDMLSDVKLKNTVVYAQEFDFMGGKLVAIYDPHKETERRTAAMESNNYNPQKAKFLGYSLLFHSSKWELIYVV